MKRILFVGLALLVVSAAGLVGVGSVLAHGPEGSFGPRAGSRLGHMWGHMQSGGGFLSDVITELLGLTPEEFYTEREAGKSLSEIAREQGIDDEALIEAIVAGRLEAIEEAVADGMLTREQADWLVAKAQAMAPFMLSNPFGPGGMHGRARGMMRGGFGGWGYCH
jgi:hypothetical protein